MTGELTSEFVEVSLTEDGRLTIEPDYMGYLRSQGYLIDSIEEVHTVDSSSKELSHVVVKLGTFEYPRDHPALDYAEHSITLWVCDCEDFRYRKSVDLGEHSPAECEYCKHIEAVALTKAEKAKKDTDQRTL